MRSRPYAGKAIYLASSNQEDLALLTRQFARVLETESRDGLRWVYRTMPDESHATIYQPAALSAFRQLFKPNPH